MSLLEENAVHLFIKSRGLRWLLVFWFELRFTQIETASSSSITAATQIQPDSTFKHLQATLHIVYNKPLKGEIDLLLRIIFREMLLHHRR